MYLVFNSNCFSHDSVGDYFATLSINYLYALLIYSYDIRRGMVLCMIIS